MFIFYIFYAKMIVGDLCLKNRDCRVYIIKRNYLSISAIRLSVIFCMVAGLLLLILSCTNAFADDAVVDKVSIKVPVACTFSSATTDGNYSASLMPGDYDDTIGSTTFEVLCNDSSGYSLYAIGYSGEEYGNTDMISSDSNVANIETGTATSGNTSNWAMKLEPISGTYAPTISNGTNGTEDFSDFHEIPETFTKVASFSSVVDGTVGSKLKSTYLVYASPTQIAGTYIGKVKYTLVHPVDADIPTIPRSSDPYKIGYYPNYNGGDDTMGTQDIDYSTTLWASNFKRQGYGFAGWSDKNNWELNENDASGNGTGVNAGYHIYGPNEILSLDPDDYEDEGLSLYAVWVKPRGNLQNWTGCDSLSEREVIALTDLRDNDAYAVTKLPDGNCWMMENLRLDYNASHNTDGTLAQNYDTGFVGLAEPEYSKFTVSTANTLYDTGNSSMMPRYRNDSTARTVTPEMTGTNQNVYSYGNYYTWAAANAMIAAPASHTTYYSTSICPAGWSLPYGGTSTEQYGGNTKGGYAYLDIAMGGTGASQSSAAATTKYRKYPVNYVTAGQTSGANPANRGNNGYWWSSTTAVVGNEGTVAAYGFTFQTSKIDPGAGSTPGYAGRTVRCVLITS